MVHSLIRASVSGLFIAFAGTIESPAQPALPDLPNVVIDPLPSPIFTEGDSFGTGVKLDAEPPVALTASFSVEELPDDLVVSFRPSTLTFDADNWNELQSVTVDVGHDDDAVPATGKFEYSISAPGYPTRVFPAIPIRILDDDVPALSLSRRSVRLVEGGNPVRYEVALAVRPTAEVVVELSLEGAEARKISIAPTTLTFTPAAWDVPQTVTLRAPGDTGVAPLMDASVLHVASGAPEFGKGVTASLALSVSARLSPVSELSVRSLADGFEVSWTPLSEVVAGYRIEFVPWTDTFGRPGSNPGAFVGPTETTHEVTGLEPESLYQVRIVAFEDSRASPQYGFPTAARLVVIGESPAPDPAFPGSADAASALVALGVGTSVLETVATRVAADREPVAHASPSSLAAWLQVLEGSGRSGAVLAVHEQTPQERAERERARRSSRKPWGLPGGPVERGDWSTWLRADFTRLGGQVEAYSLDGSARVLHLGVERAIEAPASFDRFSKATSPDGQWLVGVGLGFASSSVDIDSAGASLDHSTRLLYPYLGYRDERKLAYALVGGGLGTSTFRHPIFQAEATDQDAILAFAGLGGSVVLGGRPDRVELLIRTSTLGALANTDAGPRLLASTVGAYRARLGLDARHARTMRGGLLSPSASFGILYDGGDGPSGLGVEADAGLRFDWRRFSFSARARTLLESSDDLDRTLGLAGAVRYSPGGTGRGFFLTLAPSYGDWLPEAAPWDRIRGSSAPRGPHALRLATEAGYAFPIAPHPGTLTVAAGTRPAPDTASPDVVRAGIRYRSSGSLAAAFDVRSALQSGELAGPSVSLRVVWSF